MKINGWNVLGPLLAAKAAGVTVGNRTLPNGGFITGVDESVVQALRFVVGHGAAGRVEMKGPCTRCNLPQVAEAIDDDAWQPDTGQRHTFAVLVRCGCAAWFTGQSFEQHVPAAPFAGDAWPPRVPEK